MNSKNLQYFLTVADEHSISAAARKLYIAQPSLSQYIGRIEESVGAPLFKRTPNGLELTDVGQQFYITTMKTESLWKNFTSNLMAPDSQKEGNISFGITFQLGMRVLPDLLIKFNRQFPKMNCHVYDKRHVELEKSLLSGELDLAVTHIQKTQKKPALSYDCFLKDPMVVIASPQRKLSQEPGVIIWKNEKPVIDVRALKNEKFIYPKKDNQCRQIIDALLAQNDILYPNEYLTNNQFQTIQALVSANLGIGIIPRSYVTKAIPIEIFEIPDCFEAFWECCIATRKNYRLNYIEERFGEIVKECCIHMGQETKV